MRRWIVILLLLIYPFQLALALGDRCCLTTPAGVTHHGVDTAKPVFTAGDNASAADPHCSACVFGQILSIPQGFTVIPPLYQPGVAPALPFPPLQSLPAGRPERPQWMPDAA